jgi:predicted DNA-binding protein
VAPDPKPKGRPRVLQDVKLTSVKMGADHWERLTELAQEAGCSRAEWLRRAIMAGER